MRTEIKFQRLEIPKTSNQFEMKCAMDGGILGFSLVEQEKEVIVNVQGDIGDPFDGVTVQELAPAIQAAADKPLRLRITTMGGHLEQAIDAYDVIVNHPKPVEADIFTAWSAGTIIAAAADTTRIAPSGRFGVHQPWAGFMLVGNAPEIRDLWETTMVQNLERLDKMNEQMIDHLAIRSKASRKQIAEWVIGEEGKDGTEFIGQEAIDAGFIDSLIPVQPKAAKEPGPDWDRRYRDNLLKVTAMRRQTVANNLAELTRNRESQTM